MPGDTWACSLPKLSLCDAAQLTMEQLQDQILTQLFAGAPSPSCHALRGPCPSQPASVFFRIAEHPTVAQRISTHPHRVCFPSHMRAGHETTGATLASLLPELQRQPAVMERLRREQAEVVQRHGPAITCARRFLVWQYPRPAVSQALSRRSSHA